MAAITWKSKADTDAEAAAAEAERLEAEQADDELAAAIAAVDTTGIVDPAAKAAVDALRDALLGRTRPGRVAGRPT
jgi:hypothetical protein